MRISDKAKFRRFLLVLVVLVVLIAGFARVLVSLRSNPLVGTWTQDEPDAIITLDFRDDHSCWLFIYGAPPSSGGPSSPGGLSGGGGPLFFGSAPFVGTYQVTRNEILLTFPNYYGKRTVFLKYTLSGDELTLELPPPLRESLTTVVLHRVGE